MYEKTQMVWMDTRNLFTNKMWLFYSTLFPIALVLIMGYLSEESFGKAMTSYDYYTISMMIYTVFSTATLSANSFMEEKIKAGNMRIIYCPIPSSFLYQSKIISTWIFGYVTHMVSFLLILVMVEHHLHDALWMIMLLFLVAELFASTIGVMMCCILKSESSANQIISSLLALVALLGGCFFSMERLGGLFAMASKVSPFYWIMNAIFLNIYDGTMVPSFLVLMAFGILSILCLMVCRKTFHVEDCL